jgi:hypothetical protein
VTAAWESDASFQILVAAILHLTLRRWDAQK